jgi:hypothetical protein
VRNCTLVTTEKPLVSRLRIARDKEFLQASGCEHARYIDDLQVAVYCDSHQNAYRNAN